MDSQVKTQTAHVLQAILANQKLVYDQIKSLDVTYPLPEVKTQIEEAYEATRTALEELKDE